MKNIVSLLFGIALMAISASASDVIKPGAGGIFLLTPENGDLKNLTVKEHDGMKVIDQWKPGNASATWKIDVPAAGVYTYEVTWSASLPFNTLVTHVNGKKWLEWKVEITWNWASYQSRKVKKAFLQQGVSELTTTLPIAKKHSLLNLAAIRLIPVALDKKIIELKKKPNLGMSFEEMQLLYGYGSPMRKVDMETCGSEDSDADLFKDLNSKCTGWEWIPITDFTIEAAFFDNKCIGLKVKVKNTNLTKSLTQASSLLPGVKFSNKGYKKGQEFTTYSPDENKKYKFQFWGDCFDLKDIDAIRQIQNNSLKSEI